jgi:hypothetical protein
MHPGLEHVSVIMSPKVIVEDDGGSMEGATDVSFGTMA